MVRRLMKPRQGHVAKRPGFIPLTPAIVSCGPVGRPQMPLQPIIHQI
jgi:hypothetical protein